MDKVRDHVEALPVDVFLARVVEMKLLERIGLVADYKRAAWRVIDHYGVAIVDDAERDRLVIEFELRKVGELGVADCDG
jgi:hypothetical protein